MPTTFSRLQTRRRGWFGSLIVTIVMVLPLPACGYVLMGEHVLDRMVKALGRTATLEADQTLTLYAGGLPLPTPLELAETIHIGPPAAFRSDAAGGGHARSLLYAGGTALMAIDGVLKPEPPPDWTRYHDVLVLRSRRALVEFLRSLGVDVTVSSLGRWEDEYGYVVGARFPDEEAPQLWVSKDTFLPFRLLLPSPAAVENGLLEIRYRNWTTADGAAYPMHTTVLKNHQVVQEIRVDRVAAAPTAKTVFDPAAFRRQFAQPAATPGHPIPGTAPQVPPPSNP